MIRKITILVLVFTYLYTLTFGIFLNQYFRIPTVLLFCFPLIILFGNIRYVRFIYGKELLVIFLACFLFSLVGNGDTKGFIVDLLILGFCCLYFNYFVRDNRKRFNLSVLVFFGLLLLSGVVLLLNQFLGSSIEVVRAKLLGAPIAQSPSGIATAIFTFGYQMAALTGFLFVYALKMKWNIALKLLILIICLAFIYFGMQRSVIVTFVGSVLLFLVFYYKARAVYILGLLVLTGVIISSRFNLQDTSAGAQDNVLAKNERNAERGENRSGLVFENLNIYSDYPYGLIFYGKNWGDVTQDSLIFRNGLTSHNAYLMFITFLGPFLGIGLLILVYFKIYKIFKEVLANIRSNENSLLICLCFAFIAVSMNSLFHNGWLLNGNGPTVFLYFAIMQLNHITKTEANT